MKFLLMKFKSFFWEGLFFVFECVHFQVSQHHKLTWESWTLFAKRCSFDRATWCPSWSSDTLSSSSSPKPNQVCLFDHTHHVDLTMFSGSTRFIQNVALSRARLWQSYSHRKLQQWPMKRKVTKWWTTAANGLALIRSQILIRTGVLRRVGGLALLCEDTEKWNLKKQKKRKETKTLKAKRSLACRSFHKAL